MSLFGGEQNGRYRRCPGVVADVIHVQIVGDEDLRPRSPVVTEHNRRHVDIRRARSASQAARTRALVSAICGHISQRAMLGLAPIT